MAEQQTALITAGGSGIGLQMAHQFLAKRVSGCNNRY